LKWIAYCKVKKAGKYGKRNKAPTRVWGRDTLTRECWIFNFGLRRWPYYAPNPLRGGAPKGARGGRVIQRGEGGWIDFIRELR